MARTYRRWKDIKRVNKRNLNFNFDFLPKTKMLDLDDFGSDVEPSRSTPQPEEPAYPDEEGQRGALVQWTGFGAGEWIGSQSTIHRLPPGMYTHRENHDNRMIFKRLPTNVDDLIRFPDGITETVLSEIENFWTRGDEFKRHGFLHRRGYLFYGPQGSGKSSIVQQVIADIINREGVVFLCGRPSSLNKSLQQFRSVEPDRQVVCIFEDIDAIVKDHGEDEVLSLLDGENQINKVLNIATTNYPERLDRRIVARPRRFDRVLKIDHPDDAVRRVYFENKFHDKDDVEVWVAATKGLSFASLAEAVISVKCLGNSFEDTMEVLRKMSRGQVSSHEFDDKLGFKS